MNKSIVIGVSVGLICLVSFAYARGSIRQNATNCFFDALKEQQTANPEKTHYLRDIIPQLPKVA